MKKSIIALLAVVGIFALSSNSHAVPAFARQTGQVCTTCHFQQFPLLNAYGRAFVRSGYTMVGGQSLIEGDGLSIPVMLNASLITQIKYVKTNGDSSPAAGSDNGEIIFPNEAALFLGGRVAEHIGFALEAQLADPDAPTFTNFKMPFGFDAGAAHLEVAPFTTDGFGPSYGFELLNTGAVRQPRPTEHRADVSAQQYVGLDKAATGFAFIASNDMGFVNATLYAPVHGTAADTGTSFLNYFRVAATPQVAGWDLGIGAQLMTGTSKAEAYTGVDWNGDGDMLDAYEGDNKVKADAMAFDAQAQGMVGSMPLGVYVSYAVAPKSDATGAHNFYNRGTKDKSAIGISALLSVTPKTEISVGTRQGTNNAGKSDNAIALGVKYLIAQNMQLSLNHSIYSGDANDDPSSAKNDWDGDQKSTLMLFAAF